MTDTTFGWAVIASVGTHAAGLATAAVLALGHGSSAPPPVQVPIEVVKLQAEEPPPPPPRPERRPAPRLARRIQAPEPAPVQPSTLIDEKAVLDVPAPPAVREGMPANAVVNQPSSLVTGPHEGGPAGAGALFSTGDLPVRPGRGVEAGSGGAGRAGSGLASAGVSDAAVAGVTSFARPLGGYQTKPAYPESARTAGIEGTTVLRFVILADGLVGPVNVERSAGHADLDRAAVEAVKTWRFEPARRGKEPVPVWVTVPVHFQLTHH